MSTEIRTLDGRVFTLIRQEPYQRKDGAETVINVWESMCQACARPFEVAAPLTALAYGDASDFGLVHCPSHRLTKAEVKERWLAGISRVKAARAK